MACTWLKPSIVLLLLGLNKTAWGPSQEGSQVLREALLSSLRDVSTVGQSLNKGCWCSWLRAHAAGVEGDWRIQRRQEAEAGSEQRRQLGQESRGWSWGPQGKPWKETLRQEHMILIKSAGSFVCFRPCASNSP